MIKKVDYEKSVDSLSALASEIGGLVNQQEQKVVFKGLISQKLLMMTKFKLKMLLNKLMVIKKTYDDFSDELIKEIGTQREDGVFVINPKIKDLEDENKEIDNPAMKSYIEAMEEVGKKLEKISIEPFSLDEFKDVEIEENYPEFLDLLFFCSELEK